MDEKILTPEQVAQNLQVHPFTVLKFIKQGKLRASRLGRVYRIRQSDVDRFLDEQETGTRPSPAPQNLRTGTKAAQGKKVSSGKDISLEALSLKSESKEEALTDKPSPKANAPKKTDHKNLTESTYEGEGNNSSTNIQTDVQTGNADASSSGTNEFDHYILD